MQSKDVCSVRKQLWVSNDKKNAKKFFWRHKRQFWQPCCQLFSQNPKKTAVMGLIKKTHENFRQKTTFLEHQFLIKVVLFVLRSGFANAKVSNVSIVSFIERTCRGNFAATLFRSLFFFAYFQTRSFKKFSARVVTQKAQQKSFSSLKFWNFGRKPFAFCCMDHFYTNSIENICFLFFSL